jgi:hypothetical protein
LKQLSIMQQYYSDKSRSYNLFNTYGINGDTKSHKFLYFKVILKSDSKFFI